MLTLTAAERATWRMDDGVDYTTSTLAEAEAAGLMVLIIRKSRLIMFAFLN